MNPNYHPLTHKRNLAALITTGAFALAGCGSGEKLVSKESGRVIATAPNAQNKHLVTENPSSQPTSEAAPGATSEMADDDSDDEQYSDANPEVHKQNAINALKNSELGGNTVSPKEGKVR